MCNDGRDGPQGAGFVCPNGTLFDQYQFACEFWNKVKYLRQGSAAERQDQLSIKFKTRLNAKPLFERFLVKVLKL